MPLARLCRLLRAILVQLVFVGILNVACHHFVASGNLQ